MNILMRWRWLICWLYAVGILGLSILPAGALESALEFFPHQDKLLHALMYGGWAAVLGWAVQAHVRRSPLAWMLGIVLTVTAYGILMEILQQMLPWAQRTCSGWDALANLVGAALAVGFLALHRLLSRHCACLSARNTACNAVGRQMK